MGQGDGVPSKVLIADDSSKVQRELSQMLQESGVEVVTVSNGEHAVRKLSTVRPDLVLADIFMPVRSGYEVCEYIKNNYEFAHIGVLLLTSKLEPFDEKEARRVRADGTLEKPFADPAAALATIKRHLEKASRKKPVPPPPPREEKVVAAVPTPPEPEPEFEVFATQPPPVSFDAQVAPRGFTEFVEETPAAGPETAAFELEAEEALPAAEVTPVEEPPPTPAGEETVIEKPALAAVWEMTGPEPGAPEIPSAGDWDSQWKGSEEEPAALTEAPPTEEASVAPAEATAEPAAAPEEFAPASEAAIVDPAAIDAVVNQVLERLTPQVMATIGREIVRPLAEALLKEKFKA